MSKDVVKRQQNRYFFRDGTLDFYTGWMLGYSQTAGISPGALYYCLNRIKPATPKVWVNEFSALAEREKKEAEACTADGCEEAAAQHYLAASCAARAALNLAQPGSERAAGLIGDMGVCFMEAMELRREPIALWQIPYRAESLPAYVSTNLENASELFVVVGGGDTYREDLWYFGGKAAIEHGFATLMADLPGQGSTPDQGLFFSEDTIYALDTALNAVRERGFKGKIAIAGWSGGGFFVAKYMQMFGNADAWIASTPVRDMAKVFEVAMPIILRKPEGFIARTMMKAGAMFNPVVAETLNKYEYQFGPGGIAEAMRALRAFGPVDAAKISAPLLAMVGASEDQELRVQGMQLYEEVSRAYPQSKLIEFLPGSGADAHSQVNSLPLAMSHIFYWLRTLGTA